VLSQTKYDPALMATILSFPERIVAVTAVFRFPGPVGTWRILSTPMHEQTEWGLWLQHRQISGIQAAPGHRGANLQPSFLIGLI